MAQSYTHALEFIRGWFSDIAVQFTAKLSANVTFEPPAGRCMHLNASGELETGCAGKQMPMFMMGSSESYDVTPIDSDFSEWVQGTPLGDIDCIVGNGSYELSTTEYDTTQDYLPNQLLRAVVANTTLATGGTLTNQGVVWMTSATGDNYTTTVGVVSVPPAKRIPTRIDVLRFWTHVNMGGI